MYVCMCVKIAVETYTGVHVGALGLGVIVGNLHVEGFLMALLGQGATSG